MSHVSSNGVFCQQDNALCDRKKVEDHWFVDYSGEIQQLMWAPNSQFARWEANLAFMAERSICVQHLAHIIISQLLKHHDSVSLQLPLDHLLNRCQLCCISPGQEVLFKQSTRFSLWLLPRRCKECSST